MYAVSLFLPVFNVHREHSVLKVQIEPYKEYYVFEAKENSNNTYKGIFALEWGWWGLLMNQYAWLANIILIPIIVCIATKNYKFGLILSLAALMLCLQSYMFHKIPQDEGGVVIDKVDSLAIGFYVWLSSFIVFAICSILGLYTRPE